FILECIPAIVLGLATIFYLTDWPSQVRWLSEHERAWLVGKLHAELQAKKRIREHTILQTFCDRRVLLFTIAFFLALSGALGNIYWIPTFVKRLSGFSDRGVTTLLIVPAVIGIAGMLINGWYSDKKSDPLAYSQLRIHRHGLCRRSKLDSCSANPRSASGFARVVIESGAQHDSERSSFFVRTWQHRLGTRAPDSASCASRSLHRTILP